MADLATCPPLTRASVVEAHSVVKPYVHYTPVVTNATLTAMASTPRTEEELKGTAWAGRTPARPTMRLFFKCENLQRTGAFKIRGAFHALERLQREPGWKEGGGMERGVVTHSSGNHAQAVALAAQTAGIPAHIVMPSNSARPKMAAVRGYGAHITFSGPTSGERAAAAVEVLRRTGGRLVHPYDHPDIILGQGTMALELLDQARAMIAGGPASGEAGRTPATRQEGQPDKGLDAIVAPIGGGGMLAGIAVAAEGSGTRVFGAEPEFEGADDARRGLAAGRRIEQVVTRTIADGLRTPVGEHNWGVIHDRKLVAGVYAVSEKQIRRALGLVLERAKMVVEPSAAVPLAVALYNEEFRALVEREAGDGGWDVGIVLSGGNVGLETLGQFFAAG